ncbi:MAG: hypothetical protein WCC81_09870 [Pseudolabrys sp.]
MTRYKGRQNAKTVERDFPYIVEMAIPDGHGQGRRDERGQYFIRWCFADPAMAKSFGTMFCE